MEISKTTEEIGKYFNEILGYFLPGLTAIFLIIFFLDSSKIPQKDNFFRINLFLFISICYINGYIIHGISLLLEKIKFFPNNLEKIKQSIINQDFYRLAKEKIRTIIPELDVEKLDFSSIRNFAMAYSPETDQKIYTFMFRSDLFKHTKDIFLIISLWGGLAHISYILFDNTMFFNINKTNIYLIIIMFILTFTLNEGEKKFLKIAYEIPFIIFLAKVNSTN